MKFILIRILGTTAAVLLAAYLVPGFHVADVYAAVVIAIMLGIIGVTLKPILVILTLPITVLTLGLFSFVINAGILLFLASFVKGFSIDGFFPALVGGAVIALVQWAVNRVV